LPLPFANEDLHVVNVTECINVLDQDRTRWTVGATSGRRLSIESYAFHPDRLTETPLFKIPETAKTEIYTAAGLRNSNDEFKGRAEKFDLKGLIFEEIWSNE
jgi:hypothetical protein